MLAFIELVIVGWLPGAVLFRLPIADRDRRAALPAEERVYWAVVLSVATSLSLVLALAALHRYSFKRLLIADLLIAAALAVAARFDLRLGAKARRPGLAACIPLALVLIGAWRFLPPSEYIIGGKDPGRLRELGNPDRAARRDRRPRSGRRRGAGVCARSVLSEGQQPRALRRRRGSWGSTSSTPTPARS